MTEFAEPYSARVTAIMLGTPEEDSADPREGEATTIGLAMAVTLKDDLPEIEAALARLYDYCDAQIADRRANPREDFVTAFVNAADPEDGRLSDEELRDGLTMLIFAAFDTTRNQLGLAMQTFPGQPRPVAAARPASRPRRQGRRGDHAPEPDHPLGDPRGRRGLRIRGCGTQGRHHRAPLRRSREAPTPGLHPRTGHHRRTQAALRFRRRPALLPGPLRRPRRYERGAAAAGRDAWSTRTNCPAPPGFPTPATPDPSPSPSASPQPPDIRRSDDHPPARRAPASQRHQRAPHRRALETIAERGVEFVYFQAITITGRVVGKVAPARHFERLAVKGVQQHQTAIANPQGTREGVLLAGGVNAPEYTAIPDLDTFAVLPWDTSFARVFCRLYEPDHLAVDAGIELACDSRALLQRAHTGFTDRTGLELRTGCEPEMTWQGEGLEAQFRPGSSPAYHIEHLERNRPIVKKVVEYAQALGLDMIEGDYEDEFQVELNFMYDHANLTADRLTTYRQICKQVARELGIQASFMPKPATGMMGNGCHHNFSLWRDGVNVLIEPGVTELHPLRDRQARPRRVAVALGGRHAGQRVHGELLQTLLGRRAIRAVEDQLGPGQQDLHGAAVGQRAPGVQAARRRREPLPVAHRSCSRRVRTA